MGNSLSKFCQILSYPLRLYEWKKTKKVYDELFTDEFDANLEEIEALRTEITELRKEILQLQIMIILFQM